MARTADRNKSVTYKESGVDVDAGNDLVRRIAPIAKKTYGPHVLDGIGGFAGLFSSPQGLKDPVLVAGTDGVGTKLAVAIAMKQHRTVGIDLVAMSINDILTVGARPLFFLDYYATGKLDVDAAEQVIEGIAAGCTQSGCALLGGETAELPGFYDNGVYDLAGFAVGIVERSRIIDGRRCEEGDLVIGLPSSGLHSNGYSLARKVLAEPESKLHQPLHDDGPTIGDVLLTPTKIYASAVNKLLDAVDVRAFCHITGGGLVENPPRVIPKTLAFRFNLGTWSIPEIMIRIQENGNISAAEMRRTFNMGLGFLVVVPADQAGLAVRAIANEQPVVVGEIVRRTGEGVEWA